MRISSRLLFFFFSIFALYFTPDLLAQDELAASLNQQHQSLMQDRLFDLNGDGTVTNYKRNLALRYAKQQVHMNCYGEIDKQALERTKTAQKKLKLERPKSKPEPEATPSKAAQMLAKPIIAYH